ncbi:carboxymuconolactone decarboxylase family protein [Mycobacterium sp. IDR2000157661]|uniref:carboxymuconolactone decarboxylase family protein n=1 Tax=Mycobacterium sp. IDR2000157661 TaxID=2867005 RepID=UPI001EEB42D3|nr:carboxymuconolactone decarboxylase family protein [Mycobacterium sp. IDR2000157661]ULE33369.1 carboxymuconolactone decarboxylase family protein [Mycobacterium sp. IDR2000157661]
MTEQPPLLTPPAAGDWGPDEYAAVGALFGAPAEDVPRAGSGDPRDPLKFDILGVLVRHPQLAREFLAYNGFLLQRGELSLRLRELVILRLAHARRSAFFWAEHHRVATSGGMDAADIDRLARGNDEFDGVDAVVLEATDEMLAAARIQPQTWHRLVEHVGTHQAIEVIFVFGTYALLATAMETWQLAVPPGSPALPGAS